jgi:uncharacterized membrane protein HdeD (DUF308 family)
MLQIVLGGLCIVLSVAILAYIGPAILVTILILSLILLAIGIERVAVGIALRHSSRRSSITNIVLGLAVVSLSIVLMQFTSAFLVILAAVALLLSGISRIIHGVSSERSRSSRGFLIGVGVISIAVSILVIAHPISFGLVLFAIFISVAFLISGIEMMALGISGRQEYLAPSTTTTTQ